MARQTPRALHLVAFPVRRHVLANIISQWGSAGTEIQVPFYSEPRVIKDCLSGRQRAIASQMHTETVSKVTLGKLLRDGVERIWAFPSA